MIYLELVSFTPAAYIKSSWDWGWKVGQHLGDSIHSPDRMKQWGTWAASSVCYRRCQWYEPFFLPLSADQEPLERGGGRQSRPPLKIAPETVCAALFSPLILISCFCFRPRMIEARAWAGPWASGQLGLAPWQRPGSEKQWWWGPLSCWPSLWKPRRNHALRIKQVRPGAGPFSWKVSWRLRALCA